MSTAPTGFDQLAAAGVANAQIQAQKRSALDMLQRKFLADQYANLANQPLPDQNADPEGYQKALDQRAKALEMQQKVYSPEHHASLAEHLHGLIFGSKPDATTPASPQPPAPKDELGIPYHTQAHPFATNPAYTGLLGKLDELGKGIENHLSAFAHSPQKPDGTDWKSLAAASTPDERSAAEAEKVERQKHQDALDLLAHKPKPRDTVQKAEWDAEARRLGLTGYDDPNMTSAQAEQIAASVKEASTLPTWKTVTDGDTIYAVDAHDPSKRQPIGKKSEVTTTYYDTIQQQANGDLVKIPMVRYTRKGSGEVLGEMRSDSPSSPVSTQAPQVPLAAVNAGIAASNAASPKLNKGKKAVTPKPPVSSAAPKMPTLGAVVGHRPNLIEKSDAQQYTKIADDADAKKEAYQSAQKALAAGSTPSSDQELIFAWVRSNVQGAGRMTQAEFRQAASVGSLPQRAQNWWSMTLNGTLTPDIEKMMFADIKRSYETAQQEADELRKRVQGGSSNAPPPPPHRESPRPLTNILTR